MRIEKNGHVYDTERSVFLGVMRYYANNGEIATEKLYQTVSGAYFIHGKGGNYRHTEGTFFTRKVIAEMILPKDEHFAAAWLKAHCNHEIGVKNKKVLLHVSIREAAKQQLFSRAMVENCGLGEMIEKLIEKSY